MEGERGNALCYIFVSIVYGGEIGIISAVSQTRLNSTGNIPRTIHSVISLFYQVTPTKYLPRFHVRTVTGGGGGGGGGEILCENLLISHVSVFLVKESPSLRTVPLSRTFTSSGERLWNTVCTLLSTIIQHSVI